jgi:hypothetical protein
MTKARQERALADDHHDVVAKRTREELTPGDDDALELRGGRAAGGRLVRSRRAQQRTVCQCCSCLVNPGEFVYMVEHDEDGWLVICSTCAGEP